MEPKLVMYQEIPYEINGLDCLTPCPFNMEIAQVKAKVGSARCVFYCKFCKK